MSTKSMDKNFPIICVGGSAGGLDAYIRLLKNLPADLGVAIVIVNHLRTEACIYTIQSARGTKVRST